MKFINLLDSNYLEEYGTLCYDEWSTKVKPLNISEKVSKIKNGDNHILVIGLLDNDVLLGFISLFKYDGVDNGLGPWYATMYVKKEYRGLGYSKLLNDELIRQSRELGYSKIYLKTDLNNYYEKFGAVYLEKVKDEKIYYIEVGDKNDIKK